MGNRTPLEKANAAARKSEHLRDAILTGMCLFLLVAVIATAGWLISL